MKDTSPTISVLMSVHNGAGYLREAIDSILVQTHSDFEFIIVDDGSTDQTEEIVRSYLDQRIILLRVEHAGLAGALNHGISHSSGTFIARMDADDRAMVTRLEVQLAHFKRYPGTDVLCTDVVVIDSTGRRVGEQRQPDFNNELLRDGLLYRRSIKPIIHPSVMMRRSVFDAVGGYRKFLAGQDHDLWLRTVDGYRFERIPNKLLEYRMHDQATTRSRASEQATSAAASSVNYLIKSESGLDAYLDEPELFEEIVAAVRSRLDVEVLGPALTFRSARRDVANMAFANAAMKLIIGAFRYGPALLPSRSRRATQRIVEDIASHFSRHKAI